MQLQTVRVCQVCGLATARDQADDWLVSPHRTDLNITIVRCPEHWSEWALRQCRDGRTRVMRDRMKQALALPVPVMPASLSPFPTTERDA